MSDPVKHSQKFEDGSTFEFSEKEKAKKEVVTDATGATLKLYFRNGTLRTFKLAKGTEMHDKAAGHGLSQKIGDSYSGLVDTDDAIATVDKLWKAISTGDWAAPRVSDGMAGAGLLARALVKITGKSIEDVRDFVSALSAKEQAAMRKDPSVAKVIAEIEAERAAKAPPSGIDVKALFAKIAGAAPAEVPAQAIKPTAVPGGKKAA